ncbi:hypothetical protein [Methylobacterium gnaphalii]|uniref:Uncharacterized protein n=1 Tax=Methylobacterium gnaphalii TaxID=1010610 RepID=A0A512JPG9_9HYPH|nr:hypothetical protein [Methylobacterium gnaphalii]GEP11839.1 hypothetical protein MGN01_36840 [Methylobacterium gnaphalii]GJD69423.1 hypothetical protein MMMDOFMJ_2354 [Methylobacterium gnaphalii]GLS49621.1 hypothetical protein GCM10007885_24700 [Methylobacterium gnaphalii]
MAALASLALRIGSAGASALGVSLPVLAILAGLALGAGPAGFIGLRLGQALGYRAGVAAADRTVDLNRMARDLAEARVDLDAERAASASARADAQRNAAAQAKAEKRNDAYARELAARGPLGACGLSNADLRRLRVNDWLVAPDGRRAKPAPRR